MKLGYFLTIFVCCLVPLFVNAQDFSQSLESALSFQLSPQQPGPNERVEVSLEAYSSTLFGASIRWFLNNEPIAGSENLRTITIQAGDVGSAFTVRATLTLPNGTVRTVTETIRPLYLDIIVEPQTHIPDFYQGRALASVASNVNLTALMSDGRGFMPTDLIYTWRINGQVFEGGPLRGRNSISFITNQDTFNSVALQVSTPQGVPLARRSILIPIVQPQLLFYEDNPLYGLSPIAIPQNFTLPGDTISLRATPFYLSSFVFNTPDVIEWEINGRRVETSSGNPYQLTLERTGEPGRTQIDFMVRSLSQLLQFGRGGISVGI